VDGLRIDAARMRRNIDASFGLTFSGRVLLALVEAGLARERAYEIVQGHAHQAWADELPLRDLLEADPQVTAALSPAQLDRAFDLEAALAHADTAFLRVAQSDRHEEAVGA
jgi:adenylosuccinate lyase